jgi:hypothetical protein
MRPPVAAYAAVLDGRHLWLALPGEHSGTLALRPDGGDLLDLGAVRTERWLEARADLETLLPAEDATYDVVLKGSRLKPAKPVHAEPFTTDVGKVPVTSDRTAVLDLERTEDGRLRLRRRGVAPTAVLDAVELRGERVHLTLGGVATAGCHLLFLDQDDAVLGQLPVTAHDGVVEALVGLDDLPAGHFGMLRLAVGTPDRPVRVRRREDDLLDANRAVLLPELLEDDEVRARLRWNPDGLLAVRHLAPGEQP